MLLIIDPVGVVHGLYGETIDLAALGPMIIRRASHVEPDSDARWWANLSPVNGLRLGPFDRRSEALSAEQAWLERHLTAGANNHPIAQLNPMENEVCLDNDHPGLRPAIPHDMAPITPDRRAEAV
jgi:hypothetical protein